MGLADLSSREAVVAAVGECDALGRQAFLERYGYAAARGYILRYQGADYDSKAIAGVAHGKQFPEWGPLRSAEFSGGERTVARKLRELGFEVTPGRGRRKTAEIAFNRLAVEAERSLRTEIWAQLQSEGVSALRPGRLRELGVYGGAQGVWVDVERTADLLERGDCPGPC